VRNETRLNVIIVGALLAAFSLVHDWITVTDMVSEATAFHADTGQHASLSAASHGLKIRLAGSALLFIAGVGLSLFAASSGRRLK
jgi:hypothetical protein